MSHQPTRRNPPRGRALSLLPVLLIAVALSSAAAEPENPDQLLVQADRIKLSKPDEFSRIIAALEQKTANLTAYQSQYLRYLRGWQHAYAGNYDTAIPLLEAISNEPGDVTLQFRAGATVVNILAVSAKYKEAFSQLNHLLERLPRVTDKSARQQGMGVAAYLFNQVGEYTLARDYSDQVIEENWNGHGVCRGSQLKFESLLKSGELSGDDPQIRAAIGNCMAHGELLLANAIRTFVIRLHLQHRHFSEAIQILDAHYDEVQLTRYPRGISEWDALLALAHQGRGDLAAARRYALRAIEVGVKDQYTEPLVIANRVLYEIADRQGDTTAALAFLKKYAIADKGYIDDVSIRQLAYERVKHETLASKLQIDALNQQNQVLQLQRQLDEKAAETSRLYIALLILVVVFIALWAYRTKRSQLYFMKLSQVDGLTGIANRPRFIQLAESVLENGRRTQQQVSVVLCDLDHFKSINDRYGHAAGDYVLKQAVQACQAHLRVSDIFGRFGGEEFGIVLPGCSLEDARQRAEQLRVAIAAVVVQFDEQQGSVSASFGVASTNGSGYELRQLLAHADAALYQAKHAGRNRVVPYDVRRSPQEPSHPVAESETLRGVSRA